MDLWTIGLFLDYFLDYILDYVLDYFFKPTFYQKVIFRVGILFIYGAEEGGNGNMKMPPKQWQEWYIVAIWTNSQQMQGRIHNTRIFFF